jgi:uncharacterized protein YndB with AHSA1/START domain
MLETGSSATAVAEDTADRELIVSRLFDAPRELVWQAWADPEQKAQWWGPLGFTTTTLRYELRVGGVWQQVMRGPDGTEYPNRSVFTEVVPMERVAYNLTGGRKGSPEISHHSTWTFETEGDQTRLTIHMVFPTAEQRNTCIRDYKADEGGRQTLQRLADHLAKSPAPSDYVLHISRMLDAPRELVYKAFTDPGMLAEWMGPRGFTAMDVEQDLRVGGNWRLRLHQTGETTACDAQGQKDLWQHGEYLEIVAPERLVYTFAWENRVDIPIQETTITVTFRELEGKTVMDFRQGNFTTVADRDGHNVGWSSTFDRLTEFVAAEAKKENSPGAYELVIERIFDAPRKLVWDVWTDPAHASEWMGPRGFTAMHLKQDVRPGGKWRLCLHSDGFDVGDGQLRVIDIWQGGVYREIEAPERIVYTFAWEDRSAVGLDPEPHETVITVTFKELGEKTAMTFRQAFFTTVGERDGHTKGWNSSLDRFGELVQEQHTKARK